MNLKFYLQNKLEKTIISIWPIVNADKFLLEVNYPPDKKFGDYTTNIAMKLALLVHKSPMEIADHIKREMGKTPAFNRVEVVPPGFLNFYLKERWLARQVNDIVIARQGFGKSVYGRGVRVQVEFISANPTGPLHLGNGRGGFAGDVLANILKLAGYTVQREYYINNIGNQINILAESVLRRYWKHKGIKIEYPDYCYKGKYIDELAKKLFL
ncbi:arginine--tRNA ligase, partial [Patescibacteria group bacterium]|nr:arginine--tRNA ligase [Patescibacteria group bacterium]